MGTSLKFFTDQQANTPWLTETIHAGFGTLHLMEEVVELR